MSAATGRFLDTVSTHMNAFVSYVKESAQELRKVSWPSRQTVIRDTIVVVVVSLAMAVFFGAVDFGLSAGLEQLLAKFQ